MTMRVHTRSLPSAPNLTLRDLMPLGYENQAADRYIPQHMSGERVKPKKQRFKGKKRELVREKRAY